VKRLRTLKRLAAALVCGGLLWLSAGAVLDGRVFAAGQQSKEVEKKPKDRSLAWTPPLVDAALRGWIASPPCTLTTALERAGARANELATNLQNFTAQESIEYQAFDHLGYTVDGGKVRFEYVVVFQQGPGGLVVQESRNPTRGSRLTPAMAEDVGLPEIALIFLPEMQDDYAMRCEGTIEHNGQATWVVHFDQRKDRPRRTISFRGGSAAVYPAKVKGRAWISADSGEVMHMETSLMEEIPEAKVRHWYLSLDYAPVQFRTRDVRVWLPQTVETYCDFQNHRAIAYHAFTDFLLFSVETDQKVEKPQQH
jgi:hypothetical protein